MPGVILTKVDTTVGTSVKRGRDVMVLEAMKMKNELQGARKDGVVAEIYVAAGQQVKFGETLVRFEA
jgi:biotin carboxyl carrier protein